MNSVGDVNGKYSRMGLNSVRIDKASFSFKIFSSALLKRIHAFGQDKRNPMPIFGSGTDSLKMAYFHVVTLPFIMLLIVVAGITQLIYLLYCLKIVPIGATPHLYRYIKRNNRSLIVYIAFKIVLIADLAALIYQSVENLGNYPDQLYDSEPLFLNGKYFTTNITLIRSFKLACDMAFSRSKCTALEICNNSILNVELLFLAVFIHMFSNLLVFNHIYSFITLRYFPRYGLLRYANEREIHPEVILMLRSRAYRNLTYVIGMLQWTFGNMLIQGLKQAYKAEKRTIAINGSVFEIVDIIPLNKSVNIIDLLKTL
ncbi:unnamed protein product [Caenorhabditis bovis]|uniref:Uncharacterized protein n=1 Tax=Caenorhabditis bovis TaxID=2654633 RepID=A0A8S1FBV3_9PELO|nr:unnamed protein product [Caenorhabditis bovis]